MSRTSIRAERHMLSGGGCRLNNTSRWLCAKLPVDSNNTPSHICTAEDGIPHRDIISNRHYCYPDGKVSRYINSNVCCHRSFLYWWMTSVLVWRWLEFVLLQHLNTCWWPILWLFQEALHDIDWSSVSAVLFRIDPYFVEGLLQSCIAPLIINGLSKRRNLHVYFITQNYAIPT